MSPGAFQKFAIFVVEILDGNTAEYKPCAQFEGRFHEQQAKFKCNEGSGQLGQFVYIRDDRVDREYFGLCEVQVFQKRGNHAEKKLMFYSCWKRTIPIQPSVFRAS